MEEPLGHRICGERLHPHDGHAAGSHARARVVRDQNDLGERRLRPRVVVQELLGSIAEHVDAAGEPGSRQLAPAESAKIHGALREVVVSDADARLARRLLDHVLLPAPCGAHDRQDTVRVIPEEGCYLGRGHGRSRGAYWCRPFLQAACCPRRG